jgi:hypothetical protein
MNDGADPVTTAERRARELAKGVNGNGFGVTLGAAVRSWQPGEIWRTPDSAQTGGPRNRQGSRGAGHQVTIAEQAEALGWRTPHARDGDKWNNRTDPAHQVNLSGQVSRYGRPDQEIATAGQPSSSDGQISPPRRLNPLFVEWLMGVPEGWTSLAPIDCASSETP